MNKPETFVDTVKQVILWKSLMSLQADAVWLLKLFFPFLWFDAIEENQFGFFILFSLCPSFFSATLIHHIQYPIVNFLISFPVSI